MSSVTTPYSYTFYSHYNYTTTSSPRASTSQTNKPSSPEDNVTSSYSYSQKQSSRRPPPESSSRLRPPQSSYLRPPSEDNPHININPPRRNSPSNPSSYQDYKANFNYSTSKPNPRSAFDEMRRSFDDLKKSSVEFREPVKYPNRSSGMYKSTIEPNSKPLTYPYVNPGKGFTITGNSKFSQKGSHVTISLDKISNQRQGGKSGTLQLRLIRMSYFYDGKTTLIPSEFSEVGVSHLGQLEDGWCLTEVVRTMESKSDQHQSYRKCYVILLEEYCNGRFQIVDYVNFD